MFLALLATWSSLQLLSFAAVAQKQPQTIRKCGHGCVPIKVYLQKQVASEQNLGNGLLFADPYSRKW